MKAQTARLHVVFSSLTKTSTGGVGGGLQQRYCSCSLPSRSSRVMVCMAFSVRGNTSSWSASKRSPTKMVNGIPTNLLAASFCRGGMSLQRQTERVCVSGERECVCACVCVSVVRQASPSKSKGYSAPRGAAVKLDVERRFAAAHRVVRSGVS